MLFHKADLPSYLNSNFDYLMWAELWLVKRYSEPKANLQDNPFYVSFIFQLELNCFKNPFYMSFIFQLELNCFKNDQMWVYYLLYPDPILECMWNLNLPSKFQMLIWRT